MFQKLNYLLALMRNRAFSRSKAFCSSVCVSIDLKKKIVRIHEHIYQSKCSPTKHIIILYKVLYYSHKLEIRCCLSIAYPHRHAFDLFMKKKNQHLHFAHFARHFHSFFLGILILLRIVISL